MRCCCPSHHQNKKTEPAEGPKIWANTNRFSISASALFSMSAKVFLEGGGVDGPPDSPTSGPPGLEAAEPKI